MFNRPLEQGSGDSELDGTILDFALFAERFHPDMIFIAMGADGHESDPLSTLNYTIEGMVNAVRQVRQAFRDIPILLGGAGGYQPDSVTPEVWARMAIAVATPVDRNNQILVDCSDEIGYLDDSDERNSFHMGTHNIQVSRHLLEDYFFSEVVGRVGDHARSLRNTFSTETA